MMVRRGSDEALGGARQRAGHLVRQLAVSPLGDGSGVAHRLGTEAQPVSRLVELPGAHDGLEQRGAHTTSAKKGEWDLACRRHVVALLGSHGSAAEGRDGDESTRA